MNPETVTHLILAPAGTTARNFEDLIAMKYPDASREKTGAIRIASHIVAFGPLHTVVPGWLGTPEDFDSPLDVSSFMPSLATVLRMLSVEVAKRFPVIMSITTLKLRGDRPRYGTSHPDGLFNAFPAGLPERSEREAIDLAVGMARYLGGAVCFADVGAIVIPNPKNPVDFTIYSPYALAPLELQSAISQHAPGAHLEVGSGQWLGPSSAVTTDTHVDPAMQLTADELAEIHAMADAYDAAAMDGPESVDGYSLTIPLGKNGAAGIVEVRMMREEEIPPAVKGKDWCQHAVSYSLVWGAPDEDQLAQQHPNRMHVAAREEARALIKQLAIDINLLVKGVVVNDEGYVVPLHKLS